MRRYCDGNDPNLVVDLGNFSAGESTLVPCKCGLSFDDVQRSSVWPHVFIDGRKSLYPTAYSQKAHKQLLSGSDETEPKTLGIPAAQRGALQVLQFATPETHDPTATGEAAREIASYHTPVGDQAQRHGLLSEALKDFLCAIAAFAPPGPERSRAISRAREAKFWASAAIALEGK